MRVHYPDAMTLREALTLHFRRSGFNQESWGPWVRLPWGLRIPNPRFRQRSLPLQDLHHVLAGYDTSLIGEGEVSAWEMRTGLPRHPVICMFVLGALTVGCFVAFSATREGWRRGRGGRNLFREEFRLEMLNLTVGELRRRCGLA